MNGKKAKKLRKFARQVAVKDGKPLPYDGYYEDDKKRKYVPIEKVSGDGKGTYTDQQQISPGTISLGKQTVKGVYRALKKSFKRLELRGVA